MDTKDNKSDSKIILSSDKNNYNIQDYDSLYKSQNCKYISLTEENIKNQEILEKNKQKIIANPMYGCWR